MDSTTKSPDKEVKFDIEMAPEDTESHTTVDAHYAPSSSATINQQRQNEAYPKTTDRTLVTTAVLYTIMIAIMLIGPIIIYATAPEDDPGVSSPDYDEMIATIVLLYTVGTSAFITTLVSLVVTIRRWAWISNASKSLGLFPTVCSTLFVVAMPIWAKVESNGN